MVYIAVILLIISSSVTSQWTQPNTQYQPASSSLKSSAGNTDWSTNTVSSTGNSAVPDSEQYAVSSSSTAPSAPAAAQAYQGTITGPYTTGEHYSTATEITDKPYSTTDATTSSSEWSPEETKETNKKIVEAQLVESGPTSESTTSEADVPGSESQTALAGNTFQKHLVDEINKYRMMHGSIAVTVNSDLTKKAMAWSQKMAADDRESLDIDSNYGQLTFSGDNPIPDDGVAAVRHWYNRIKNYAWDHPKISTSSMQFTQLVWVASKQVGVGKATSATGKSYVTALFSPPGNKQKEIAQNVLSVTGSGAGKRGPDSCPSGWHKLKKSCYRYFNNQVKWSDAVNLCDDEHSSLASLENIEEETSVRSMLARDEGTEAWMGLSDRVNPETKNLVWVDGKTMTYSNWNTYQDDTTEGRKCGVLSIATEGWMYKSCKDSLGFICKTRLKDIMTYLIDLKYTEKLWTNNLKSEASPRYMAMKKHLDQAVRLMRSTTFELAVDLNSKVVELPDSIMNLYNDDDWFVDMLFEGFSTSADDKVTAEFKLRFSPDGDAPSDPLDKLRTKLESTGLIDGEKLILASASLQNEDPDSCPTNCLNDACKSSNCPIYCCRTFQTRRKSAVPPSLDYFKEQRSFKTNNKHPVVFKVFTEEAGKNIQDEKFSTQYKQLQQEMNNLEQVFLYPQQQRLNNNQYRVYLHQAQPQQQQQQQQQQQLRLQPLHPPQLFPYYNTNDLKRIPTIQSQLLKHQKQLQQQQEQQEQQQLRQKLLNYQYMDYLKRQPQQQQQLPFTSNQQNNVFSNLHPSINLQNIPTMFNYQQENLYRFQPSSFKPLILKGLFNNRYTLKRKQCPSSFKPLILKGLFNNRYTLKRKQCPSSFKPLILKGLFNNRYTLKRKQCPSSCPEVCAPSCVHGCCRSKRFMGY